MRILLVLLLLASTAFADEAFIYQQAPTGWFDADADRLAAPAWASAMDDNAASTAVTATLGANGTSSHNTNTFSGAGKLGTGLVFARSEID